jgi:carboxypeptidase family protein
MSSAPSTDHEFTGRVLASDTAVSGATITVKNTETGSTQTTVTDDNGFYQIYVSVGTYDVTVTKPGYTPEMRTNLTMSSDTVDLGVSFNLKEI